MEWLGSVPSSWRRARFKEVFREREERSIAGEETLLSVSAYTGVTPRSEILDDGDHLSRAESLEGYKVCYPNDLVMNIMLAWNRGLGMSPLHGICSPAYSVFQVVDGSSSRYLHYLLRSDEYIRYFKAFSAGVIDSRLRLYPDAFGALTTYLPSPREQAQIAAFLDRETAKIDALVAEQEQLISLLKEKRQAVICQAVTKGLDPSVPMKDSGVEWLGEVPAHWSAVRLKFLASDIKAGPFGSALTKDMYASSGYRVYGQEQVIPGDFSIGDYYIDEATFAQLAQYATQEGDVLISCVGTFGKIAVVPESAELGIINPRLIRLRVVDKVSSSYLAEVLRSTVTFEQFSVLSRGGTMDVINIGTLSDIWVAVPPYSEQQSILEKLQRLMREFDALVDEAVLSIELLRERRSALISAAVTGQIDVRGWESMHVD
ncbi:restriction endonuclease subunit S [Ideonella paludis]|uniref:restriction endonuclease subunit S n=1 Tax=Ideonella paludis TaxID=1233411 RepID=UPI001B389F80|nr:restriction endonuclease subunit S [Ideonella paludis]